jgi:HSP20 family protein
MYSRYEPWSLLNLLQRELERNADPTRPVQENSSSVATAEWSPTVDIKEEEGRFLILADLPGVSPAQIDVSMEDGILTLRGERETEAKYQKDAYKRVERVFGSFYRRFSLPDTADAESISAKVNSGVLEIVIPKKSESKPRKILVSVEE